MTARPPFPPPPRRRPFPRLLRAIAAVSTLALGLAPGPARAGHPRREAILESGDRDRIAAVLAAEPPLSAADAEDLKWRARAHAALGQHVEAAEAWRRAADRAPADRDAFRGLVFSLADLGASARALELAKRHWDWFQPDAQLRLAGDLAAARVRWMDLPRAAGEAPEAAFERAHAALAEAIGKPWTAIDGSNEQEARIGADRLIALAKARRFDEALAWRRDLRAAGIELKPHAQAAAATALAGVERPAAAARRFVPAVRELPWDIPTGMACYYALSDAGRPRQAARHLAAHAERQARWEGGAFLGETLANQAPIEAEAAAAVGLAWAGDPEGALARLRELSEIAPAQADFHLAQAEVELSRGRPRAAQPELRRALAWEPASIPGQAVDLECRIETGAWSGIEADFARLRPEHPEDTDLSAAWSLWRWETAPLVDVAVTHGRSDGVESPGRETLMHASARSAGFGPDRRQSVTVSETSEWATFPEGDAEEHRAGATWRLVLGEQSWEIGGGGVARGGFHGAAGWEWRPSDALEWSARGELDSLEAPLRGRRAGVTADRLSLGAVWSWGEKGGLSASADRLFFNDGNVRQEIGAAAEWRIWHAPGWDCLAGAGAHASWGREVPDAVYFNPASDASPEATVTLRHRLRGNATHEATVFGGFYAQDGFATLGYGGVRYRLECEIRHRARLFLSGEWLRHPYDGQREDAAEGQVGLAWRF